MENLREELLKIADEKYKRFQSGLCPNTEDIIGVRIPALRKIAKEISKEEGINFLKNYKPKFYEEKMIYGMIIGYTKLDLKDRINYLEKFLAMIDNWAICDVACSTYKFVLKNQKGMWDYINKYVYSKDEFKVRFAVVIMLSYYINDEYIDEVLKTYNNINLDKYYVKMGVAWGISIAFVNYEEKTMNFLKNNNLDKFTYNKSLQKIIESYRVSANTKEIIRKMKIK